MRRLHRTGRQDHLATAARLVRLAVLTVLDTHGALAFQQDARGVGLGLHAQVLAAARRIEKGARRGPAPALLLGDLVVAEALLLAVVVVRVARIAFRGGRIDKRIQQFGALDHVGDVQRAAAPPCFVPPRLEMFGLAKIGQYRF